MASSTKTFTSMWRHLRNRDGSIAFRSWWPEDDWIYIGTDRNRKQVVYLHRGVHSWPYSFQQDDLFASDWEVEDG